MDLHYRVRAYNTATASTNKIHDDAVARELGFRGGLVPGVDVYAYLCHLPAERWGQAWLERGTIAARFESPVYDGDEVEIAGRQVGDAELELTLSDPSGARCAIARAALPTEPPPRPAADSWPSAAPPAEPPQASPRALTDAPFGSIETTFLAERAEEYLDDIRESLPLFRDQRLAHPGWLLRFANYVLTANVRMGPWIHVESKIQFLGAVGSGDRVETRALVTALRERGGHRFVDLDVLQLVADRPVTRTAHCAIYEPRGTRS
jgi:acyl dehydratase